MVRRKRMKRKLPKKVQKTVGKFISEEVRAGRPREQAIAIAFSRARKKFPTVVGLKR